MTDADNDEVRCRWASGYAECGDICGGNGIPNAWMHFVSPKSVVCVPGAPWAEFKGSFSTR